MTWDVSFTPNGQWFVFSADTGETLAKPFRSKLEAVHHGMTKLGAK